MTITLTDHREIPLAAILDLYHANQWSSAEKPTALYQALMHSHTLLSAWDGDRLVGIGNAISDGYLVVYYPHLLVHPAYQGQGIGRMIMEKMQEKYSHFHMQILTADSEAVGFYQRMGFVRAGRTEPMWIYQGEEH
ncbi:MAG: GNAT family N-acetyltransferase [Lewinellaceae bacterium]|nr:GNAT family N-acetyltransferase [Lewinellaceae bacterium]